MPHPYPPHSSHLPALGVDGRKRLGDARLWGPHSRDPMPGRGHGTLATTPWGLTVKYARNGGSVDAETEGGDGFAIVTLVVCHAPLQEKARQGRSCRDPLCGQGSPWDGVLQGLIHTGVQEDFWLPHGGTLRLFCPRKTERTRLLIRAVLGGNRTRQRKQPEGHQSASSTSPARKDLPIHSWSKAISLSPLASKINGV